MIPKTTVKILKEFIFTPKILILMKFLVLVVTKRHYLGKNLVTKWHYLGKKLVTKRCHLGTNLVTKHKNLRVGQGRSGQVKTGLDRSGEVRTGKSPNGVT